MRLQLIEENVRDIKLLKSGTVDLFMDSETGVNYFIGGDTTNSISICPRYNADGTLYVSKI